MVQITWSTSDLHTHAECRQPAVELNSSSWEGWMCLVYQTVTFWPFYWRECVDNWLIAGDQSLIIELLSFFVCCHSTGEKSKLKIKEKKEKLRTQIFMCRVGAVTVRVLRPSVLVVYVGAAQCVLHVTWSFLLTLTKGTSYDYGLCRGLPL
jgi:hypothetical protein